MTLFLSLISIQTSAQENETKDFDQILKELSQKYSELDMSGHQDAKVQEDLQKFAKVLRLHEPDYHPQTEEISYQRIGRARICLNRIDAVLPEESQAKRIIGEMMQILNLFKKESPDSPVIHSLSVLSGDAMHVFSGVRYAATPMVVSIEGGLFDDGLKKSHPSRVKAAEILKQLQIDDYDYYAKDVSEMMTRFHEVLKNVDLLLSEVSGLDIMEDSKSEVMEGLQSLKNLLEHTFAVLNVEKSPCPATLLDSFELKIDIPAREFNGSEMRLPGQLMPADFYLAIFFSDFYKTNDGGKARKPRIFLNGDHDELLISFDYKVAVKDPRSGNRWTVPWAVQERLGKSWPMILAKLYFENHLGATIEVMEEGQAPLRYMIHIPLEPEASAHMANSLQALEPNPWVDVTVFSTRDVASRIVDTFKDNRRRVNQVRLEYYLLGYERDHGFNFAEVGIRQRDVAQNLRILQNSVDFTWDTATVLKAFVERVPRELRRQSK